jgi:plasmid stability protein
MPTLHVRNLPPDLYKRLQNLARSQRRSLSSQIISLLEKVLSEEEWRQSQAGVFTEIRRERFSFPGEVPDSVHLLREDRER